MIAKYAGPCYYCGKPIQPGVDMDIYDVNTKKAYHKTCHLDSKLDRQLQGVQLAAFLGFVPHDDATIRAEIPRWRSRWRSWRL